MIEKSLHAGSIAAAFGVIATSAELTLAGGAGTAISAALSATAMFNKAPKEQQRFATMMAKAMDAHLAGNPHSEDDKTHLEQMLELVPLTADHLYQGDLTASVIAREHRARVAAETKDTGHQTRDILDKFERLVNAMLDPVEKDEATAFERETLKRQRELLELARKGGQADKLRDEGITENAILRLAQRIAADVEDVGRAWLELQNAMDIAVNVQREGSVGTNHSDFVDAVLARVAELSRDGANAEALGEIEDALQREEVESQARKARLLDSGVEQAILARDPEKAAELLERKVGVDIPDPAARFAALRKVQDEWYERGRDKGLNFDLEISIELARASLARAASADERGAAGNDLGIALSILGEREPGTDRLKEAVTAYRAALEERTRDRVPLDWAMTQMNLGAALKALGERETGTERLEEAVAAYRAALQEWTRDRVPLDWAMTQMNLGNALTTLGEREPGTERLEEAVAAYRDALEERTRDRVPLDWARTQMNLGTALTTLGEREPGTERLEEAVAAYRDALEEWTRDRVPLDWARTQMNLGSALTTLGQREPGTERLEEAVAAYRDALEEWTRDRVPLDWANTLGNQGVALLTLAQRTEDLDRARRALDQLITAEAVLREGGHAAWAATKARQIPVAQALVDRLSAAP